MGFWYPPFQNPQKPSQWEESTNIVCAIWSYRGNCRVALCYPRKATRTHQGTATKNQYLCACCLCSNALKTSNDCCHFSNEIFGKSQKSKQFSAFRDFSRFFNFSMFSTSRFIFLNCRDFRLFEQKSTGLQALCFFFRVFDFSRPKVLLFTVWLLPARRAQRLNGLCSKGIKITVTALEGWLGLRESFPNYRKFQVSEIYCNNQIRLVTHFPVFGSDFHIEDSFPNEQVKSENFPKCASSFLVYRFVTWCSCTHLQMCT